MNREYTKLYGTWTVTTEGDCEGKTVKNLGVHKGYVDEIAFHFADKAFYSLQFKKTAPVGEYKIKSKEVSVSFDIDSETWGMEPSERAKVMKEVFKDRPVHIRPGNHYASFIISTEEKPVNVEEDKEVALSKLTDYERSILGI